MRITKYAHSCVLIQDNNQSVLFDPGIFSWQDGSVNVEAMPRLDYVVVTHQHADHCAEPFIRALIQHSPSAQWLAPSDTHALLKSWGVVEVTNKSVGAVTVNEGDHAPVEPFGLQVNNLQAVWNDSVLHPGDSHAITATPDVLLLPVQAPWGTTIQAVRLALDLSPKYIVPIHDWMWNDSWRQSCYDRFEQLLEDSGTTFIRPVNGETFEVNI